MTHSPISSDESSDEALFVRRILEFWRDKEHSIVKSQIEQFIHTYPQSEYVDSLLLILGDTFCHEKNYEAGLAAYNRIQTTVIQEKVFNNRLDCLYHLHRHEQLTAEIDNKLYSPAPVRDRDLWTYYKAEALLNAAKQDSNPESRIIKFEQARLLFDNLISSEHKDNAKLALIEIEVESGRSDNAAKLYMELAQDMPENKHEMLLHAARLQGTYSPKDAIPLLDDIQKSAKTDLSSQAALNKVVLLFEEGLHERIISEKEILQNLVQKEQMPFLHFYIGRSYYALNEHDQAIQHLLPLLDNTRWISNQDSPIEKTILLTVAACAHHQNDLTLLDSMKSRFEKNHAYDPLFAKILYMNGLTCHRMHKYKDALEEFQRITKDYPSFEQIDNVLFEKGVLEYKTNNLAESRKTFLELLENSPHTPASLNAIQYLPCISLQQLEQAEERGEACLQLRETLLSDICTALQTEGALKQTQRPAYLLKLAKVNYDMFRYEDAMQALKHLIEAYPDDENLFQAHLLLAICYQEGMNDPNGFALNAERVLELKPEFGDQARLRLNLFNTYLEMARETTHAEQAYTEKAADHLFKVYQENEGQIKPENKLWMGDYFYARVKTYSDDYEVEQLKHNRALEYASKALSIYSSMYPNADQWPITNETVNVENELFKLSNLHGWLNDRDMQIKILDHLYSFQKKEPQWAWPLRNRIILAKAYSLQQQGKSDEAYELYNILAIQTKPTDRRLANTAKLQWARLKFQMLPQEKRSIDSDEILAILKALKDLQIQKNIAHEPIHLEAALDYTQIRSTLEPENNRNEQALFLLKRVKQEFNSRGDLQSKDYHAGREKNPSKEAIFQAYSMLIDASISRLEAMVALDRSEHDAKIEAAYCIYQNLFTENYALTKYLVDKAQQGIEMIKKSDPNL